MKTIYSYTLEKCIEQEIVIPEDSHILSVDCLEKDKLVLSILVNVGNLDNFVTKKVYNIVTGQIVPENTTFLGTYSSYYACEPHYIFIEN